MKINPEEVQEIKVIGSLNNEDVKVILLKGGLNIAVGKKTRHGRKDQPLAAGSHQGIVAHQVSKEFGKDFQPAMFKSEVEQLPNIEDKSSYLPVELYDKGVQLYTVSGQNETDFVIYRYGLTIGKYETEVENSQLVIKNFDFKNEFFDVKSPQTAKAIARAMEDKVKELGLDGVSKK